MSHSEKREEDIAGAISIHHRQVRIHTALGYDLFQESRPGGLADQRAVYEHKVMKDAPAEAWEAAKVGKDSPLDESIGDELCLIPGQPQREWRYRAAEKMEVAPTLGCRNEIGGGPDSVG